MLNVLADLNFVSEKTEYFFLYGCIYYYTSTQSYIFFIIQFFNKNMKRSSAEDTYIFQIVTYLELISSHVNITFERKMLHNSDNCTNLLEHSLAVYD